MQSKSRKIIDNSFTALTGMSILLLMLVLLIVLGPMIYKGAGAVAFKGTVEFRKMQFFEFAHGNKDSLDKEHAKTQKTREYIYQAIDDFKSGLDPESLKDQAKIIYRAFGDELKNSDINSDDYLTLRKLARNIRNKLEEAFDSKEKILIRNNIEYVLQYQDHEPFKNTSAEKYFTLAKQFLETTSEIDLEKLETYSSELAEVEKIIEQLLGPRPGQSLPLLPRLKYGATRWDQAKSLSKKLLWPEKWVQKESGKTMVKQKVSRKEYFKGTKLEPMFDYIEANLKKMLNPKATLYWRYFFDDEINSHYFGGIGPEIIGTLLLTLLSMVFVIPFGVISAAYLAECASENLTIKIIRMSINTLAGVPSIVFGLFGLAFFVLYFMPLIGLESKPCIFAASMTLAVLTLPVMIRASEEAIRSVPNTYKEASLGLGASRFRTFVKVTLPAALPGILTGIILSLSRVAGETAPILFAGAVAKGPVPKSLFQPTRSLSYGSYDLAVGDRIAMMVPHKQFGMVVTLILLILLLNTIAILIRWKVTKNLKGH